MAGGKEILLKVVAAIFAVFHYILQKIAVVLQNKVYQNKITFNTVWEDPRLDKEALQVNQDSVVLTISSGGCNGLALLLENPRHVYLIDRNPCQNALVELKIAAIKNLEYNEFWQLFGLGKLPNFSKLYYPKLRNDLSPSSQAFWDKKGYYFDGTGMKRSFYWRGTCGTVAWAIGYYFKIIPGLSSAIKKIFSAKSLEEQRKIYYGEVAKKLWNPIIDHVIKSSLYLSWTGIPIPQQELLATVAGKQASIGLWIKAQLEFVFTELPIHDNYFWRVYIFGQYTKECCPDYLKEENFATLKSRIDRISVNTETITEFLNRNGNEYPVTHFVLLDHMDWMAKKKT